MAAIRTVREVVEPLNIVIAGEVGLELWLQARVWN